ncbi:SDR family NAD(P)-dependent oxidoreductase [Novosphingobium resinovorum]|uniref:SDR family NAD(P)-dependent oxidoreductase n=1 Tax=Novosphingobium resinovorum TaxID=158500 RepID=UPI002ED52827
MFEEFALAGRVAIVTGGGTGIGRAIALLLARRGADIAVAGRKRAPLDTVVTEVEALGRRALAVEADVCDLGAVQALVEAVAQTFGRIDMLVNNAGGAHGHVGIARMDPAKWDRDVALNLNAAMYASQAAFPHLRRTRGCIVNVSSVAGMHGTQGVAAYSAAKAGVQMFTRVAAAEWGPAGVRVNAVAPGMTATEKARAGWEKVGFDADGAAQVFPLRRYGLPEDVAQLVGFLVSDAAGYITGEAIAVAGGPVLGGMVKIED